MYRRPNRYVNVRECLCSQVKIVKFGGRDTKMKFVKQTIGTLESPDEQGRRPLDVCNFRVHCFGFLNCGGEFAVVRCFLSGACSSNVCCPYVSWMECGWNWDGVIERQHFCVDSKAISLWKKLFCVNLNENFFTIQNRNALSIVFIKKKVSLHINWNVILFWRICFYVFKNR